MGSVSRGYEHIRKLVRPGERLRLLATTLKWYDIHPADAPIADAVRDEARAFVAAEVAAGRLAVGDELGFVILHRAGAVHLLQVCIWRNENELWETVYGRDRAGFEPLPPDGPHKATYCVWELGAVVHERRAWVDYLLSARDERASLAYLDDLPAPTLV